MTVIWGLDLHEIQWSKFKSSNMFTNKTYHLRRTKFLTYQAAMLLTIVSESLGTAALSDYTHQQTFIAQHSPTTTIHNNTFIGIASYNIFVGIYVSTIFGAAFFFDLIWPARHESRAVKTAWRVCSVLACVFALSCALAYTYIVATKSAWVTGTDKASAGRLLGEYGGSLLRYARNGRAVASVVFLWAGVVCTGLSTGVMWWTLARIERFGPLREDAREGVGAEKPAESVETGGQVDGVGEMEGQSPPIHVVPEAGARV